MTNGSTKQCLICRELKNVQFFIPLSNDMHTFCSQCFKEYIKFVNLSIYIDNADMEEWLITASSDMYFDGVLRFRHPYTNEQFSEEDLRNIYNHYKLEEPLNNMTLNTNFMMI